MVHQVNSIYLILVIHDCLAEFTIEADREHAEWNMTRPVENVATITKDELIVVEFW